MSPPSGFLWNLGVSRKQPYSCAPLLSLTRDDFQVRHLLRALRCDRQLPGQLRGNLQKTLAHFRFRILDKDGHTAVAALAQRRRDGNLSEIRNAEALGRPLRPPARENLVLLAAAVADEVA